jgi:hypothetical protein
MYRNSTRCLKKPFLSIYRERLQHQSTSSSGSSWSSEQPECVQGFKMSTSPERNGAQEDVPEDVAEEPQEELVAKAGEEEHEEGKEDDKKEGDRSPSPPAKTRDRSSSSRSRSR